MHVLLINDIEFSVFPSLLILFEYKSFKGVPYFYLTNMDMSTQDLQKNPKASVTISLAQVNIFNRLYGNSNFFFSYYF